MIIGFLFSTSVLLMKSWSVLAQEHLMLIGGLVMGVSVYPMGLYLVLVGVDANIAALTYGTIGSLVLGAFCVWVWRGTCRGAADHGRAAASRLPQLPT
jgi:hypothetical protein